MHYYVEELSVFIFVFAKRRAGPGFEPGTTVPCSSQRKKDAEEKEKKPNNGKRRDIKIKR
jgi:hypothetical protein